MKDIPSFAKHIMQLIAKDEMKKAIEEAQNLLKDSPLFYELMLQSARYSDIMKSIRMGTIDDGQANITKNKIRYALIDMLRDMEESGETNEKIQSEVQSYLQKRESVTNNSANITGDGNFNIQGLSGSQVNINIGKPKSDKDNE